jgi:hypothetical protein
MRDPRKPGRKAASRSSVQKKSTEENPPGGDPTWPRLDLVPPEHVLGALRDWGRVILKSGYLNDVDRAVVEKVVEQSRSTEEELFALQIYGCRIVRRAHASCGKSCFACRVGVLPPATIGVWFDIASQLHVVAVHEEHVCPATIPAPVCLTPDGRAGPVGAKLTTI